MRVLLMAPSCPHEGLPIVCPQAEHITELHSRKIGPYRALSKLRGASLLWRSADHGAAPRHAGSSTANASWRSCL